MIRFTCPKCVHLMKAAPETTGRKTKCSRCGTVFPIPPPDEPEPVAPEAVTRSVRRGP